MSSILTKTGYRHFEIPLYRTYIIEPEERLFTKHASELHNVLGKSFRDIVELWPGNEKFQYVMRALWYSAEEKNNFRYLPADRSQVATNAGKGDAQAVGITCGNAINEDRTTADFSHVQNALYLCFGWGLMNNDALAIIRNLQSGSMLKWGSLCFTYFGLPNPHAPDYVQQVQKIKAMYGDPDQTNPFYDEQSQQAAKKMILQPFVALWFPVEKLALCVEWKETEWNEPAKIMLGARVFAPFSFTLGDRQFHKEIGEVMSLIETPRLTEQQTQKLVASGRCRKMVTFDEEWVSLVIASLPKKSVPTWMKKTAIYASTILALLTWGIKTGAYIQNEQQQTKQQKIFEETFYHEQRNTKELEGVLTNNEREARKIIYLLEHRYVNQLNDQQKEMIKAMFYDWIKLHPEYMGQRFYWWEMYYSTDSYVPSMESRFVREHKNQLTALGCITTPNASLLYYQEALFNTYNYAWEQLEFTEVEQELPNYERESVSTQYNSDTKEDGFDNYSCKAGIVHVDGKPYMVFKWMQDRGWLLQEKDPELRDFGTGTDAFAIDIIQQGQVPLLAQKICQHINKQFGGRSVWILNGQDVIAKYLTDLYAEWYDLSYLLTGEEVQYRLESKPSMLESFVVGVLLPDLYDKLTTWSRAMHDLDDQKLCTRMDEIGNLHMPLADLNVFLHRYLPDKYVDAYQTQSKLLQLFLADRARTFLEDDRDRRCRLAEHSKELSLWELMFPDDLDEMQQSKKYAIDDALSAIPDEQVTTYSKLALAWNYRLFDGSRIELWLYSSNGRTGYKLVGKKITQEMKDELWQRYQAGEFKHVYYNTSHGAVPIQAPDQIINHYLAKINYASAPVHELMQDYTERKEKWKIYEAKKKWEYKQEEPTLIAPK